MLAGDAWSAEAAVLNAIDEMPGAATREELLARTAAAALVMTESEHAEAPELPPDLLDVLRLPAPERKAYVLRVLLWMTREESARALGVTIERADELTLQAMRALARIRRVDVAK